jgi:hypothetical protein
MLAPTGDAERRHSVERRTRTVRALLQGSFKPRRHGPRRHADVSLTATDWHHPQWLAVVLLILLLSLADAVLTLTLLQHGAFEANPVMALLVHGSVRAFAVTKMGLTTSGVVVLTLLARARVFGRMPIGFLLYAVLLGYAVLVAYELHLLQTVTPDS